jgi:hypothetical protein
MFRQSMVVIGVWLLACTVASADPVQTFTSENSYLLGLAQSNQVISAEGWDLAPFDDGDVIANGTKINGITYDSSTLKYIERSNIVTDQYGSRSPENALGLSFFGYEKPFGRLDAITFSFQHAISSFGISFGTQGEPAAGTYGIRTNNGYEVTSSFDSGDEWEGQFAGLIGPEPFTEVTIFVDDVFQWENLAFVLDNMIVGREQSGAISLAVNTNGGAIDGDSYLSFLIFGTAPEGGAPGGEFPAINWIIPEEFEAFQGTSLSAGDSAVVLGIIEAQFGSPHIWTGDVGDVDPDVQMALVAAWADIQLGLEGSFPEFLVQRGFPVDPEVFVFGEPGSVLEGLPAGVYLDFVEQFNPNVLPDGSPMDPTFRDRLNMIYEREVNQEQFSQSGLEEIIYPHPDGIQISTLVQIPFVVDPNTGQITGFNAQGTSANPVPEPGTLLTLGLALAAGAFVYRRRRNAA